MAAKDNKSTQKSKKPESGGRSDVTGLGLPVPDAPCTDSNCPFHGQLRLHGRRLTGVVSSARMRRTANITIESMTYAKKYERFQRRKSRLKVHNPECLSAKEGDRVDVIECRPLSKTKHFVIVRKI